MRRPTNPWKPVPTARTEVAPAPIAFGNELHLFVRDLERRLAWNRYAPRSGWGEWQTVPGDLKFADSPSAVLIKGQLHLFGLGHDRQVYQNTLDGLSWCGWTQVGGVVDAASGPHLSCWREGLFLVVRDSSNRVYGQAHDGGWTGWRPLGGPAASPTWLSIATPHLVEWRGQLYLFLVGLEGELRWSCLPSGGHWSIPQAVPGAPRTRHSPSATPHRSALVLGATGADGRFALTRQQPLSGWHGWRRVKSDGSASPALCTFDGRVYSFIVAADHSVRFAAFR